MHKYRRVSPINDEATESRAPGDAIFFRPNALFAAIALALFSLPVSHAEEIVYNGESWMLGKEPVMNRDGALFPKSSISDNTVTNLVKVSSNVYGGISTGNDVVENNMVYVKADVGLSVFGGAGKDNVVRNNHVVIDGNYRVGEDVYGGDAEGKGDVIGNTVTLKNGVRMDWSVLGGLSTAGNVRGNIVTAENVTLGAQIMGGAVLGDGEVTDNRINVKNSTVNSDITGGVSLGAGLVSGNSISLTNTVVDGDVVGGQAKSGSATGNTVTIDGGKVTGDIAGGFVEKGSGNATGNTVIIKGNADISNSVVYGGLSSSGTGDVTTGNTLQIWTSGQVTKNVVNFRNFQFIVTPAMVRSRSASPGGDALLTLTEGKTDFSDSNISVAVAAGTRPLDVGDNVVLFQNVDQGVTGLDTAAMTEMTGVQGISLDYKIDLNLDPTTGQVGAVVKEAPAVKQTTSVFSTGRMATMGFLNQGSDFALGDGLDRATRIAGTKGAGAYGSVSGKNMRYDTGHGSSANANGAHFLLGVAGKLDGSKDHDVIGSVYVESGWGDIEDHTTTSKGDGKTHYYGLGLIAKYRQNEGVFKGAYGQVNVKAGRANTDFRSNLTSAEGVRGAYDKTASYYGAGAGVGYLVALGQSLSLDLSAAYQWTHLDGYGASVAGDPYRFDAIDSHRTKVGARLNFTQNKAFTPYVGLAWEHEFSGDATGTTYGLALQKMSMKGDTGIAELGVSFNPAANSRWTVDANVSGAFGQRDGVEGRFMVNVRF